MSGDDAWGRVKGVGGDLKMLKGYAKEFVGGLGKNELMVEADVGGLTCVKVGEGMWCRSGLDFGGQDGCGDRRWRGAWRVVGFVCSLMAGFCNESPGK